MTYTSACDTEMVETLVKGATNGMTRAILPNITTHEEVLSAAFTFLDRTLRSVRKLQSAEERFDNASQIAKALADMLTDHGHVPS